MNRYIMLSKTKWRGKKEHENNKFHNRCFAKSELLRKGQKNGKVGPEICSRVLSITERCYHKLKAIHSNKSEEELYLRYCSTTAHYVWVW